MAGGLLLPSLSYLSFGSVYLGVRQTTANSTNCGRYKKQFIKGSRGCGNHIKGNESPQQLLEEIDIRLILS